MENLEQYSQEIFLGVCLLGIWCVYKLYFYKKKFYTGFLLGISSGIESSPKLVSEMLMDRNTTTEEIKDSMVKKAIESNLYLAALLTTYSVFMIIFHFILF